MIYLFRLHPIGRLYLALILGWIAYTCIATHSGPLVAAGVFLAVLAAIVFIGLGRLTGAYFRTWRG
jgi:hypothetical protein